MKAKMKVKKATKVKVKKGKKSGLDKANARDNLKVKRNKRMGYGK